MKYNFNNPDEVAQADEYFKKLKEKKARIDLTEKRGKRSVPQNSYFHLLLAHFALEYGETMEYVKQEIFKKVVNPEMFKTMRTNPKSLHIREHLRSSADLDSKEMTDAIERFKNWSAKEAGIRLPEANEQEFLDSISNEIERNKQWL